MLRKGYGGVPLNGLWLLWNVCSSIVHLQQSAGLQLIVSVALSFGPCGVVKHYSNFIH